MDAPALSVLCGSYPLGASDAEVSSISSRVENLPTSTLVSAGVMVTTPPHADVLQTVTVIVLAPSPPPPTPPPPSPPPSPPLAGLSCVDAQPFGSGDPDDLSFSVTIPTTEYQYGPAISEYNSSALCPGSHFAPRGPYAFWLRIHTVLAGELTITTCDADSVVDTNIAVFRGSSCDRLEPIACNGDGDKDREACQWGYSKLTLLPSMAALGESYYIVVTSASYHGERPPQDYPPPQNAVRVNASYGLTPPPSPPPPSPPPSPPPYLPPPPSQPPLLPCHPVKMVTTTRLRADEISWTLDDYGSITSSVPNPLSDNGVYTQDVCVIPGEHEVVLLDEYGDGWSQGTDLRILQDDVLIAGPLTLGIDGDIGNGLNRTVAFVSDAGSPPPPPAPPIPPPSAPQPASPTSPPPRWPPPTDPPNAPGVTTVTSTEDLRLLLGTGQSRRGRRADAHEHSVSVRLPAGTHLKLGGSPITVSGQNLSIISDCGDNASYPTIDAELASRAFDVSNGGSLALQCVRVVNGAIAGRTQGVDMCGGCVRAQYGASLSLMGVYFTACSSLNPKEVACGKLSPILSP